MVERSSCSAWSTGPGAWPSSQLIATRALYRGPEGSDGDLFGCRLEVGIKRLRTIGDRETTVATSHSSDRGAAEAIPVVRIQKCRADLLPGQPYSSVERTARSATS